jgi:hypothetical protein
MFVEAVLMCSGEAPDPFRNLAMVGQLFQIVAMS